MQTYHRESIQDEMSHCKYVGIWHWCGKNHTLQSDAGDLFSYFPSAQCWQYSYRQNRHSTCGISEVNCALVTVCLGDIVSASSAVFPTISPCLYLHLYLFLLFCHSSLHFFFLLSHFHRIILVSLINCFSCSLSSCQFSRLPHSLEGRVCVSPVYCVSGTFQLARILASGCVGDKMELIPPGYCYLRFPPVTHKQTYTFAHAPTQPHEAHIHGICQGTSSLALQIHWTDRYSRLTKGGQEL